MGRIVYISLSNNVPQIPVEQYGQIAFLKQFISMATYRPLRFLIPMVTDSRFSPATISKLDPDKIVELLDVLIEVSFSPSFKPIHH
jgi:hypothetical protein